MPRVYASSAASVVLPLPLGPVMAIRMLLDAELAARDDDSAAADLDALDRVRRAVDACVERREAADLRALGDLYLVAERDASVSREVQRERPCGGAGRRILGHAEPRSEHPRLPGQPVACEAVDAVGA